MFEFWWSLFVSATIVWVGEESGSSFLLGVLFQFNLTLLRHFKSAINIRPEGSFTFWAMTLLLAVVIFPLLRLLTSFSPIRRPLLPTLGAVAVCALPIGFLFDFGVPLHSKLEGVLLFFETIGAIVCVILYTLQTRHLPRFLGATLLILHFSIWGFACHRFVGLVDVLRLSGPAATFFWWMPLQLTIPILGFASCATWAMYAKVALRESGSEVVKAPA
jgi:hypothetical protein